MRRRYDRRSMINFRNLLSAPLAGLTNGLGEIAASVMAHKVLAGTFREERDATCHRSEAVRD